MSKFNYEVIFYPGKCQTQSQNEKLVQEIKEVVATCLEEVPSYQVLTGEKEELDRAIVATARDSKGRLLGFCSALVLDIEAVGRVFHTGLTCVHPRARGKKLTHKLTSKILTQFLLKESMFDSTWITNCACVLSSIGNVAKYFEEVYPSPYGPKAPSFEHLQIAKEVSTKYRAQLEINNTANFNEETFVFEGSVDGTVWEKDPNDIRFHHREKELTAYYKDLLDFSRGDEVLQVGKVSLMTIPKYFGKQALKKTVKKLPFFGNQVEEYAN